MTLEQAILQQASWVIWWFRWLVVGAFMLPALLLFGRETRIAALAAIAAAIAAGFAINWMYEEMGYVRILGLPHIVLWTPLAVYLSRLLRDPDLPAWPRGITFIVLATIMVSLAFDYNDALRYLLGERAPLAGPA
jgi:hypothetical protein